MYSWRLSEIHSVFENGLPSKVLEILYFRLNYGGQVIMVNSPCLPFIALFEQGTKRGTGGRKKGLKGTEIIVPTSLQTSLDTKGTFSFKKN